jgi:hypothetical protein
MAYDASRLTERISLLPIDTDQDLGQLNLDFLFEYQIFPDNILNFCSQWKTEGRKMQCGDTIAQQVYIPPLKVCSQKLVFGIRINEVINLSHQKGFSYETLDGHVEKGISTFTVEQVEGKVFFKIRTFSALGNLLARLLGPVFSVPYQTFCTKKALVNVKQQLETNRHPTTSCSK